VSRRPQVRIATGPAGEAADTVPIAVVPDEPFDLTGVTVVADVADPSTASAVLRAVVRGADALVHVDVPDAPAFLDALGRIADVRVLTPPAIDADQRRLLALLADGLTASEAARRAGMSLRTAHRRLAAARAALGTGCNAEAINRAWEAPEG
jgi:hypothetical protein